MVTFICSSRISRRVLGIVPGSRCALHLGDVGVMLTVAKSRTTHNENNPHQATNMRTRVILAVRSQEKLKGERPLCPFPKKQRWIAIRRQVTPVMRHKNDHSTPAAFSQLNRLDPQCPQDEDTSPETRGEEISGTPHDNHSRTQLGLIKRSQILRP